MAVTSLLRCASRLAFPVCSCHDVAFYVTQMVFFVVAFGSNNTNSIELILSVNMCYNLYHFRYTVCVFVMSDKEESVSKKNERDIQNQGIVIKTTDCTGIRV